jgi:hypothetical protein
MPKHYLSIVACLKNEAPNIVEWLEFHKLVGAEHFYLYDNESTDNTKEVLQPYVDAGEVSLFYTDMDNCQFACYFNACHAFMDQSKWMAFIDLDEFLFSPKGDLVEQLKKYENVPGIAVNQVFFGSNGHLTRPEGLVIENYTKKEKVPNKHIKTIAQPMHTLGPAINPHSFLHMQGRSVTENFKPMELFIKGAFTEEHSSEVFRIHHYFCKSREEAEVKLNRGRADVPKRDPMYRYGTGLDDFSFDDYCAGANDVEDMAMLKYVPELKRIIDEREN